MILMKRNYWYTTILGELGYDGNKYLLIKQLFEKNNDISRFNKKINDF